MISFSVGSGRVHALDYTSDGLSLLVDLRGKPQAHPNESFHVHPATELVSWSIATETPARRFRLRDSLYGPGGHLAGRERELPDQVMNAPALDMSFCASPLRVATVWEWTNKEDGVCLFDVDGLRTLSLKTPHKTHTQKLKLSPDGTMLAVATLNDMDGSTQLEVWAATPASKVESSEQEERQEPDDFIPSWLERAWRERRDATRDGCSNPLGVLADLAFDGRFVAAVGGERALLLLDHHSLPSPEGREGSLLYLPFSPRCVAFAPVGSRLLAAGGAGLLLVSPLTREISEISRSEGVISAVAFGSGDRILLAGTSTGRLEVWDTASGQLLHAANTGEEPISSVAIAPDGTHAAAGTESGRVIVWDHGIS